jgi:FAD:protein FMN transferase
MMSNVGYTYRSQLMGTTISLKLFVDHKLAAQAVFNLIKQLEDIFTVNRQHSQIMTINHAAGQHPVAVDGLVFDLIYQAKQASLLPNSCFNLAIGPLVKLWKIGFNGYSVPNAADIQQKLALTDPRLVELNTTDRTVFLKKAGMALDLGAIAKGYIADLVKVMLEGYGISQAMINLGGNVLTIGDSPVTDHHWRIGLKKPFATDDNLLGIIKVRNKSVVTSGIYERYFIQDQQLYHHIIHPQTGYPLDNELQSLTIISPTSLAGDIYSTAIFGMGIKAAITHLRQLSSIAAIFVTKDQKIILHTKQQYDFELLDNQYQISNDYI